jgi:putative DNA primase/helicase
VPKEGTCTKLLELLEWLCANEVNDHEIYQWILKWLAYPIQHRGAKMHSAIVVHGPQGTGKSRFFEAYAKIFGPYGRVLGQEALEDKFNADWAEKKLFILADEVLARSDMYHIKNRLKGFITGDTIRVNPKNVAAHNEKNQMNLVFLSNERMPLVLENDDRRHCVVWVPPKLPEDFFTAVNAEIENGGIEALHHYLLELDLGDFKPWTKPPMTGAKRDLIHLAASSEERFIEEWQRLELDYNGNAVPFCPCQGSLLYRIYEDWCERQGERKRRMSDLISLISKRPGWTGGKVEKVYDSLDERQHKEISKKMVVPSAIDIDKAYSHHKEDDPDRKAGSFDESKETKKGWLTRAYLHFENKSGIQP